MPYLDVVITACDFDQNPGMMGGQDSPALTLNRVISFARAAVAHRAASEGSREL
jgi:hypothetical protein